MSVDNESIAATTYESKISALKSQVRELEAERDRLIENHTKAQHTILKLRASHAALVEKYNELLDV